MSSVTPRKPRTPAVSWPTPASRRPSAVDSDRVTAPKALDSSAVVVTPICTAERKRLGFSTSRATFCPRRPRSDSERSWPSRSVTSAISLATKTPSTMIKPRTTRTLPQTGISASEVGDVGLFGANGLRGLLEAGELGVSELPLDDAFGAARADLGFDAEEHAVDPVFAVNPGAHGHHRTAVLRDGSRHPGGGSRGGVVRRTGLQERDHLCAAVAGAIDEAVNGRLVHDVGERLAVHRAGAGNRDHRVAVGTERERLHRADRYAERLRDEVGEPSRVEHAGLADDALLGESGDVGRERRHLVERVRHHDDDGFR